DELDADNARHFTVTVLDKLPVLLVNGAPSAVPYLNETFFLELALGAPAAGGKTVSPVQTKTVTPAEFLNQRLDDYGCVVLANVPAPTELWMDRLRRYVLGGGGLIIFAGDHVDSPAYNAAFAGSQEEVLLPALLGEVRDSTESGAEGGFRIRRLDRQHPVFLSLAEAIDTHAARVKRFLATTPHGEGRGAALADLDAGPLLLEKKAGAGTVILCTSAADLDWSNLAARSFFLPVLHQMVYYVSRSATRGHSVTVGMPYSLELPPSDAPVEVKVFGPQQQSPTGAAASPGAEREGEEEPLAVLAADADEGAHKVTFRRTRRPGIYRAVYTIGNQEHRHLFAVNVESRESELDRIEPQEAQRVLGAPNSKVVPDPQRLASLVRREREGLPLWNHLFVLAILLAVAESFVGNAVLKH
ncbi:MAG: hypothetical protein KAX44_07720, partial [Candidatus Brocadiae bacterium]|nr:hypothetical protein [Candidatus Brocadiia bacterium]